MVRTSGRRFFNGRVVGPPCGTAWGCYMQGRGLLRVTCRLFSLKLMVGESLARTGSRLAHFCVSGSGLGNRLITTASRAPVRELSGHAKRWSFRVAVLVARICMYHTLSACPREGCCDRTNKGESTSTTVQAESLPGSHFARMVLVAFQHFF